MKFYFTPLFLLCFFISPAQTKKVSFKLGPGYDVPEVYAASNFWVSENGTPSLVTFPVKKKAINIAIFDPASLSMKRESSIDLNNFSKTNVNDGFIDFGTDYYWIHSDWDKVNGIELLYADKLDINSGKFTTTNNLINKTSRLTGLLVRLNSGPGIVNKYRFTQDIDKKKMLVSYRVSPEIKNNDKNFDKLGFLILDEKMNKVWGNEFIMPYTESIMENRGICVDSKGNAYLLAKIYDSEKRDEKDKKTGSVAYHFEVFKFSGDSKIITQIPVVTGDNFIKEALLTENSSHKIVVSFIYSKDLDNKNADGVFIATLDENGNVNKIKTGFHEFREYESEIQKSLNAQERKKSIPADLAIRDIFFEKDGSIFIVCEIYGLEKDIAKGYTSSKEVSQGYEIEHNGDIVTGKINVNGDFEWLKKIRKHQTNSLGFRTIYDNSGYYFLYVDNRKNFSLPESEEPELFNALFGGQLILSKIDRSGKITKENVFDNGQETVAFFSPRNSIKKFTTNQYYGRCTTKNIGFTPFILKLN